MYIANELYSYENVKIIDYYKHTFDGAYYDDARILFYTEGSTLFITFRGTDNVDPIDLLADFDITIATPFPNKTLRVHNGID